MTSAASSSISARYLANTTPNDTNPASLAFYAALDVLRQSTPKIGAAVVQELLDQRSNIKLIASENYSSLAVQLAQGNLLTDKYAEGYVGHRFYAGCDNVNAVESDAAGLACRCSARSTRMCSRIHGADANLVAFLGNPRHHASSRLP